MTQAPAPVSGSGGQFLTSTARPDDVFVREDLSDEQRLFGQTTSEFMHKEVLPVVNRLYEHDWALTRELLKKAGDLDLLRLEIPPAYGGLGLDLISAFYVGEQIAINPSFGGSLGAHVDRHAAAGLLRYRGTESALPAGGIADAPAVGDLRAHEARVAGVRGMAVDDVRRPRGSTSPRSARNACAPT